MLNVIQEARELLVKVQDDTLKKMPVWMKCNYLLNQIINEDDQNINWGKVNKILRTGSVPYDFNIFHNVYSKTDLLEVRDYAITATMPGSGMEYHKKKCKKCGEYFSLTYEEIDWFQRKNLKVPSTCYYCRKGIEKPKPVKHTNNNPLEEESFKTAMQMALEKAKVEFNN